jgi:hypothetical protein
MKFKEKIKNWLLKDELLELEGIKKDFKELDNSMGEYMHNIDFKHLKSEEKLKDAKERFDDARRFVSEIVDTGVDVYMDEYNDSWAVVCVAGKMEYVRFVRFGRDEIRAIQSFLKTFEDSRRRVVDAPFLPENFWIKW